MVYLISVQACSLTQLMEFANSLSVQINGKLSLLKMITDIVYSAVRILMSGVYFITVEPRLSGLIGTTRNSPDNRGPENRKYEY